MSKIQHIAELSIRGGVIAIVRAAHPEIEIDALEPGAKFYTEPQVDELEKRIAELKAMLKNRRDTLKLERKANRERIALLEAVADAGVAISIHGASATSSEIEAHDEAPRAAGYLGEGK